MANHVGGVAPKSNSLFITLKPDTLFLMNSMSLWKEQWYCARDAIFLCIKDLCSVRFARRIIAGLIVRSAGIASRSLCHPKRSGSWNTIPTNIRGVARLSRLKVRTGKRKPNLKGVV